MVGRRRTSPISEAGGLFGVDTKRIPDLWVDVACIELHFGRLRGMAGDDMEHRICG